jgi:hypothetical protein
MTAAVALGIRRAVTEVRRTTPCFAIDVEIVAGGEEHVLRTLVDPGAEGDFMSRQTAKRLGIKLKPSNVTARGVGVPLPVYGRRLCKVRAFDCHGQMVKTSCNLIATDFKGDFDLILRYGWLESVNPDIDWRARSWSMRQPTGSQAVDGNWPHSKATFAGEMPNTKTVVGEMPQQHQDCCR